MLVLVRDVESFAFLFLEVEQILSLELDQLSLVLRQKHAAHEARQSELLHHFK